MNNSLCKPPFVPSWARGFIDTIFFIYNGASMRPLFKPGDLLCVRFSVLENIHSGDIVVISRGSSVNGMEYTVHRVITVTREFLITRGDNNLKADIQVVSKENLVGLVTFLGRQGHVHSIRGGTVGFVHSRFFYIIISAWALIKNLGRQGYRQVRQSGLVARVWKPTFSRIRVMTDKGPLVKYCIGTRTVARWWPQQKHFDIDKPFDLVLSARIEPQ